MLEMSGVDLQVRKAKKKNISAKINDKCPYRPNDPKRGTYMLVTGLSTS